MQQVLIYRILLKKTDWANANKLDIHKLKNVPNKLDVDKLIPVPVDLSKLN